MDKIFQFLINHQHFYLLWAKILNDLKTFVITLKSFLEENFAKKYLNFHYSWLNYLIWEGKEGWKKINVLNLIKLNPQPLLFHYGNNLNNNGFKNIFKKWIFANFTFKKVFCCFCFLWRWCLSYSYIEKKRVTPDRSKILSSDLCVCLLFGLNVTGPIFLKLWLGSSLAPQEYA